MYGESRDRSKVKTSQNVRKKKETEKKSTGEAIPKFTKYHILITILDTIC